MDEDFTCYDYDINELIAKDVKYRKYSHPEPEPHHFYVDESYKITTTCEHLHHILFYNHFQENELIDLSARLLFKNEVHLKKAFRKLVNEGDTMFKELVLKRKDNSEFWVLMCFRLEEHTLFEDMQILCQFININEFKTEKNIIDDSKEEDFNYVKTIGIVTALPRELAAMEVILDKKIKTNETDDDPNDYLIGFIKNIEGKWIRVIIALMKEMGTNNASTTCTNMLRSFNEINDVIMVGIAGGIPNLSNANDHVRLGDIVVSNKQGLLQYDNIKKTNEKIEIRDAPDKPSAYLLGKVNMLIAEFDKGNYPWNDYIDKYSNIWKKSKRPEEAEDILKVKGETVQHPIDSKRNMKYPKVFHGPIGSANTLLKDENLRDQLRDQHKIKAIEMEASGIADGSWTLNRGYLIVRGVVDYCNEDKSKKWQYYGALVAACYTKCIIERM